MAMPELLLHIGTHKTGTSSLQKLMAGLGPELRECGVLYPQAGRPAASGLLGMGQHVLAWSISGHRGTTDQSCWGELQTEIAAVRPERVVLSAEHFWTFEEPHVRRLGEWLAGTSVSVIVYLRNPLGFIISSYKQQVKSQLRCTAPFRQFAAENIHRCDYAALLERWSTVFGPSAMRVRLYDKVRQAPGLEADFLNLCTDGKLGDAAAAGNDRRANRSPSDDATRSLRLLNSIESRLPGGVGTRRLFQKVRRRFVRGKSSPGLSLLTRWMNDPICSEDDADFIRGRAAEFNRNMGPWLADPQDIEFLTV